MIATARSAVSDPSAISIRRRSGPSIRSIVTNSSPSSSPAWWIGTTFGCRSETAIRDSRAEPLAEGVVGGEVGGDHLQRDDVVERQVGRPVDDAHPAAAGDPLDPVAGEGGSRIRSGMARLYPRRRGVGRSRSGRCSRADDGASRSIVCGALRGVEVDRRARSAGRSRPRRTARCARLTSASLPTSDVASTSASGIAWKASSRLPSRYSDCTARRLLLEAEAAGEVDVEVGLPAAHAAEVEQQPGPDDVPRGLEVAVDRDLDRGADLEVGAAAPALLEPGREVLAPGVLEGVGAEEDRDPPVADLRRHLDRLAADRADEDRDLVAQRVEVELQRLALPGPALDRQLGSARPGARAGPRGR